MKFVLAAVWRVYWVNIFRWNIPAPKDEAIALRWCASKSHKMSLWFHHKINLIQKQSAKMSKYQRQYHCLEQSSKAEREPSSCVDKQEQIFPRSIRSTWNQPNIVWRWNVLGRQRSTWTTRKVINLIYQSFASSGSGIFLFDSTEIPWNSLSADLEETCASNQRTFVFGRSRLRFTSEH